MEYEIGYLYNRHRHLSSDDRTVWPDDVLNKEQSNDYDDFDSKTETFRIRVPD